MTTLQLETQLDGHRTVAVIGGQWGDEGKGKIVDLFAGWAHIVARGTGGANAGHTIMANGQQHIVHLVPSGILRDQDGVITICGNGMVIDPFALIGELDQLQAAGISHANFRLAYNASLVLPSHILLDRLREKRAGKSKLGTTGRGIGPAYEDRVARIGLIVNDLLNPDLFMEKLTRNLEEKSLLFRGTDTAILEEVVGTAGDIGRCYRIGHGFDTDLIAETYHQYGQQLGAAIDDTDDLLRSRIQDGETRILLEGAQGELLGIDGGSYPFVTSSDCSLAGLAKGVGIGERQVDLTVVVAKAFYMTRVGSGPFPTELGGQEVQQSDNDPVVTRSVEEESFPDASVNHADERQQGIGIRRAGNEYGATTGRPRRTGWLDLPLLRHTLARTGGNVVLALTKLDVLDECRQISVCLHHSYDGPPFQVGSRLLQTGARLERAIMETAVLCHCRPVYVERAGWCSSVAAATRADELPAELLELIQLVERETQVKVVIASVGPDRDQTILLP